MVREGGAAKILLEISSSARTVVGSRGHSSLPARQLSGPRCARNDPTTACFSIGTAPRLLPGKDLEGNVVWFAQCGSRGTDQQQALTVGIVRGQNRHRRMISTGDTVGQSDEALLVFRQCLGCGQSPHQCLHTKPVKGLRRRPLAEGNLELAIRSSQHDRVRFTLSDVQDEQRRVERYRTVQIAYVHNGAVQMRSASCRCRHRLAFPARTPRVWAWSHWIIRAAKAIQTTPPAPHREIGMGGLASEPRYIPHNGQLSLSEVGCDLRADPPPWIQGSAARAAAGLPG